MKAHKDLKKKWAKILKATKDEGLKEEIRQKIKNLDKAIEK